MSRLSSPDPRSCIIGIDPAREGSAVLRDASGNVEGIIVWKPVTRNRRKRLQVLWTVGSTPVRSSKIPFRPGALGVLVAQAFAIDSTFKIAAEDAYVGKNARTSLALARWNGGIVAAIEEAAGITAEWVLPDVWRRAVIGTTPGTKRADVKAASLRYIPARIPTLAPRATLLGGAGAADHVTDAAGVSEWMRTRR